MTVRLHIDLPEEAFSVLRRDRDEFAREMLSAAVCKWYELGWLSQSKAAQVLQVSRHELLDLLGRYGVSAVQTTPDELEQEMRRG